MSTSFASTKRSTGHAASAKPSYFLEGWFILLLGALSAGLLGAVVGAYAIDTDPATMATLATAGYLVGYFLAGTLIPDILAHGISFLLGVVVALVAIEPGTIWRQLRAGDWRPTLDRYETLLRGFVTSLDSGERFETDIAIFAIGLTMWLVGYTSAWILFRRSWIFWSLALPGAILLVTMALERDRPSWPALLYLGIALAMAAGHTAVVRSAFWRSRSIAQPTAFGRRSIVLGSLIATLAVGAGLYYSFDLDDRLQERAVQGGDRLANWVSNRFDEANSGPTEPQPATGNYGAFSDQFKVGDGVPTGDRPGRRRRISRRATTQRL
jgi:MFS family permease